LRARTRRPPISANGTAPPLNARKAVSASRGRWEQPRLREGLPSSPRCEQCAGKLRRCPEAPFVRSTTQ
jgi:hypothetical protein